MKKSQYKTNTEHGRGQVRHNALAALVTSVVFRSQVEKPKKGKGSYNRKHHRQGLSGAPDAFCAPSFC